MNQYIESELKGMTPEKAEELIAAFHKVKYSDNEIEATESAKFILNNHMDISGVRKMLSDFQIATTVSKDSVEQDAALNLSQTKFLTIIAQLFVNVYRMGILDQQNEYKKMVETITQSKDVNVIGKAAKEKSEEEE